MGCLLDRRVAASLSLSFLLVAFLPRVALAQDQSSGAPATDGGRISVVAKQNGAVSSASFEVHRRATSTGVPGDIVATGRSGLPVRVPSGTYDVVVRLDGVIDRPERWSRTIVVTAGRTVEVSQSFETSILEVRVLSRGRRAAATVVLRRAGETATLATLGAGVRAVISAGSYDLVVRHRAQERAFTALELASGRSRAITVDFDQPAPSAPSTGSTITP